jgi:hypothetical protein
MSPAQIAAIIATAQRPREAKILSRLYGFQIIKGQPILVESEANIIRQVFQALSTPSSLTASEILAQLAQTFRKDGVRNRSGQYHSLARLKGLVRPIYASLIRSEFGNLVRVSNYRSIVSESVYWAAARKLGK